MGKPTAPGCRPLGSTPTRKSSKNAAVASENGFEASTAKANSSMPCMAHHSAGLIVSNALRPGR